MGYPFDAELTLSRRVKNPKTGCFIKSTMQFKTRVKGCSKQDAGREAHRTVKRDYPGWVVTGMLIK